MDVRPTQTLSTMKDESKTLYYAWFKDCMEIMGASEKQHDKLFENSHWWYCYDDGLSPKEAVAEFKKNNGV